jgi:hypothetical protein
MAAGDSPTSISNMALAMLSEDPIENVDPPDNNKRGRLSGQFYDTSRRAMLEASPWRCAKRTAQLAETTAPPAFTYAHCYVLPADFIRFYELPVADDQRWEVMNLPGIGRCVVTDATAPLDITYVFDLLDCTEMTPLLVMAIAAELGANMAWPLVRDMSLKQSCQADRDGYLAQAAASSAEQASFRNLLASATSAAGISAMALAMLGEDPKGNVDPPENNRRGRLARQFYDTSRRAMLEAAPWRCAKRQVILTGSLTVPLFTYAGSFVLPADFIRFYELPDADDMRWELVNVPSIGRCLMTDAPGPVHVTYVFDLTDPTQMDPLLVKAIIADIAANLAWALMRDLNLKTSILAERDAHLTMAAAISAEQASYRNLVAGATSSTGISAMALAMLGEDPKGNVDPPENNRRARLARQFYDPSRRAMLEAAPWRCARRQAALTASGTPPLFTYSTAYVLPTDFIRFYELPDADDMRWELVNVPSVGRCLMTDAPTPVHVTYVFDLADPTQMDPLLVKAIIADIAANLAWALRADLNLKTSLLSERDAHLAMAAAISASQVSPRNLLADETTAAGISAMALAMLGDDPKASADPPENDRRARLARQFYNPARRAMLEAAPWRCAKVQAQLTASATAPLFTYGNAYVLPADFIRFYELPEDGRTRWEIINIAGLGRCVVTDAGSPLDVTYIFDLTNPTLMDPLLVKAIVFDIAANLAWTLMRDLNLKQAMTVECERYVSLARTTSAQQASPRQFDADLLLRARW